MLFMEISFPWNTALKLKKENNNKAIKKTAKILCFILLNPNKSQIPIARTATINIIALNAMINKINGNIKMFLDR